MTQSFFEFESNKLAKKSFESIGFSKGYHPLGLLLEDILQSTRDQFNANKSFDWVKYINSRMPEIKDLTGLKFKFENAGNGLNAFAQPVSLTTNHPLNDPFWGVFMEEGANKKIAELKKFKKETYVDLKNVRVGGFFSEIDMRIGATRDLVLSNFFGVKKAAAIFLHEIGHIFTYLEFSNRRMMVNQLLSEIAAYAYNKDENQKKIIFTFMEDELDNKSLDKIKNTKNPLEMIYIVKEEMQLNFLKENNISNYNYASAEQLADQFASRLGYGIELVEGLDILNQNGFDYYEEIKSLHLFYFVSDIIKTFLKLISIIGMFFIPGVWIFTAFTFLELFFFENKLESFGFTYDVSFDRFNRVKQEMIELIKRTGDKLSKEESEKVIQDIITIETIMNKYKIYEPLLDRFKLYFIPKFKTKRKDFEDQKLLEDLSSNMLFVDSFKFKNLG